MGRHARGLHQARKQHMGAAGEVLLLLLLAQVVLLLLLRLLPQGAARRWHDACDAAPGSRCWRRSAVDARRPRRALFLLLLLLLLLQRLCVGPGRCPELVQLLAAVEAKLVNAERCCLRHFLGGSGGGRSAPRSPLLGRLAACVWAWGVGGNTQSIRTRGQRSRTQAAAAAKRSHSARVHTCSNVSGRPAGWQQLQGCLQGPGYAELLLLQQHVCATHSLTQRDQELRVQPRVVCWCGLR
jgi:hypothetical protein